MSINRRSFLQNMGTGFGSLALSGMLAKSAPIPSPYRPKAKAVIQIFCSGGLSHVDTWDYKPELVKRAGQPFDPDGSLRFFASKPGKCVPGYWPFRQHGHCGAWMSDLFPQLSTCVDDMAFIHSMTSKSALHGPATFMMHSGFILPGFPSMGAWVTYGLGSESDNLPSFVVLADPRGLAPGGKQNWGPGFLPAVYQGTQIETGKNQDPISDLFPPPSHKLDSKRDERTRDFIQTLNRRHQQDRRANAELEARIASYELAAQLQLSAPEATDINGESEATRKLYGLDEPRFEAFGRQCMMARRFVERGVRFVQVYCGAENTASEKIRPNWDSHEDVVRDHGHHGPVLDRGASALIRDLQSRGLFDETLIMCTTEFGRQPAAEKGKGRDHNPGVFTCWMAGGGIKGGSRYGQSDDLGFKVGKDPCYSYDLHATALHLLGIDHEKLSYYHNGIQRRLTDVHGHVIDEII